VDKWWMFGLAYPIRPQAQIVFGVRSEVAFFQLKSRLMIQPGGLGEKGQ